MSSVPCFGVGLDFLIEKNPDDGKERLGRDIKISIGDRSDPQNFLILRRGTPVKEISSKISEQRDLRGLPAEIPIEEQDSFFEDASWEIGEDVVVEMSMPGLVSHITPLNQTLKQNAVLCQVEAMKMKEAVHSPVSGDIVEIFCKNNSVHEFKDLLVRLIPTEPHWKEIPQKEILDRRKLLLSFFPWAEEIPVINDICQDTLNEEVEDLLLQTQTIGSDEPPFSGTGSETSLGPEIEKVFSSLEHTFPGETTNNALPLDILEDSYFPSWTTKENVVVLRQEEAHLLSEGASHLDQPLQTWGFFEDVLERKTKENTQFLEGFDGPTFKASEESFIDASNRYKKEISSQNWNLFSLENNDTVGRLIEIKSLLILLPH